MPPRLPSSTKPCLICGELFTRPPHLQARYCSRQCAGVVRRGRPPYERPFTADYFWSKVDQSNADGCWPWLGRKSDREGDGYGTIEIEKRRHRAHRVAYELTHGPIPDRTDVCHSCDNPPCVRPDHLFLGSRADNMQDAATKGRVQQGMRRYNAKLTDDDIRGIRAAHAVGGISQYQLGVRWGVSQSLISLIVRGQKWRTVT